MSNNKLGVPQSHSDVINEHPSTLLIGYGWVGQFVHKYFTKADYYSPSLGLRDSEGNELVMGEDRKHSIRFRWNIAFISTPSPMNEDGSCDTSYVKDAVKKWVLNVDTFVIRSTVTPGTIDSLRKEYPLAKFVMQPEYVGETLGHPLVEPNRDPFIILGGTPEATAIVAKAWELVLHANCRIRQITALEAELCKYMENCFLATKVIFVNEFAGLCEAMGVNYSTLREAWLDDPRIGRSHTLVYKNNPGFSGKCLPKDLNSIVNYSRYKAKKPLKLIEAVLKINAEMRKDADNTVPLLPEGEFKDILLR